MAIINKAIIINEAIILNFYNLQISSKIFNGIKKDKEHLIGKSSIISLC